MQVVHETSCATPNCLLIPNVLLSCKHFTHGCLEGSFRNKIGGTRYTRWTRASNRCRCRNMINCWVYTMFRNEPTIDGGWKRSNIGMSETTPFALHKVVMSVVNPNLVALLAMKAISCDIITPISISIPLMIVKIKYVRSRLKFEVSIRRYFVI